MATTAAAAHTAIRARITAEVTGINLRESQVFATDRPWGGTVDVVVRPAALEVDERFSTDGQVRMSLDLVVEAGRKLLVSNQDADVTDPLAKLEDIAVALADRAWADGQELMIEPDTDFAELAIVANGEWAVWTGRFRCEYVRSL